MRVFVRCLALAWVFFVVSPAGVAAHAIESRAVHFAKAASSASLKGSIKGDKTIDYKLHAKAGQTLKVGMKSDNTANFFNVLPPGSEEAIFIGSNEGDRFEGTLATTGTYTIRTYLMRNAARRKESSKYTLEIAVTGEAGISAPAPATGKAFERTLVLQGITFQVTSANAGTNNEVRIVPSGLEIDNSPIVAAIDGMVTGAEVADLNVDGSPEVYVYVRSPGSGSHGSLTAYSTNRRKSLSQIYLPELAPGSPAAKGYRGYDEFAIVESVLARRFPIYKDSDTDAKPTGGMRQLQYKLFPGEASWRLKVDRVTEF